jgi:hypothetical protein
VTRDVGDDVDVGVLDRVSVPSGSTVGAEQRELTWRRHSGRRRSRCDGGSESMAIGKDASISDQVHLGWRDEGDELGQQLVRGHGDGAAAAADAKAPRRRETSARR